MRTLVLTAMIFVGWAGMGAYGADRDRDPTLVGWWKLDEGSGAVAHDASGNGFDGTLHGTAQWVRGMPAGGLRFNGASYVEVPFGNRLQLGHALTLQAWIYPTDYAPSTFKYIVALWNSYLLRFDTPAEGGRLSFFTFLNGNPEPRLSAAAPERNRWHQVFAVWDGTTMRLWLDGVKRTQVRAGAPAPQAQTLRFGENFVGSLGEVKIYDRALSDEEVLAQVPAKLAATLQVDKPVGEIGQPLGVTCTVSNLGGQPLQNGWVKLLLPSGLRLAGGTTDVAVASVTHNAAVRLHWQVQAQSAQSAELRAIVEFAGQPSVTQALGVVVAKSIPAPNSFPSQPSLLQSGDDLVLGNNHVRLVFPRNTFGYGVFAVDVNQTERWQRLAVANSFSALAVRSGTEVRQQFVYGDTRQALTNLRDQAGVEFHGTVDDGTGNQWNCQFTFSLGTDDRVKLSYQLTPERDAALVLLQGPTLFAGEGSFGTHKDDALFCGLEWLVGDEASSSNLDMHDPDYYVRFVPHPNKITIPLLAVAHDGAALALYWDCRQAWDGQHDRPAAVFASPNFLDGQANHLLGLFLPSVPDWVKPNQRDARDTPYPATAHQALRLDAWLAAVTPATQALACVSRWFDTFGVPDPAPLPRGDYLHEVEFSMRAFVESLWDPAQQKWWTSKGGPGELSQEALPPAFAFQLRLAASLTGTAALREQFTSRAALAEQLGGFRPAADDLGLTWDAPVAKLLAARDRAAQLLDSMGDEGAWRFHARVETSGIFAGRDYGLLGPDNAAEVGTCARNAYTVLSYARLAGDAEAFAQVQKALQFMSRFTVPRAAQVWECPVHAPDLLAAADAVDAYVEAYRCSGERRYLDEAVRWARTGLPFIYVWYPAGHPALRYASIAIFGGSWYDGSWIGQPVQWNGLRYAYALLKLADYDASFPWRKIGEGITASALCQQAPDGSNVALWPDNFSALDWSQCAWVFEPGQIVKNVCKMLGRDIEPVTAVADGGIRIDARARIGEITRQDTTLAFLLQFPSNETGQVLLTGLNLPREVQADGLVVPFTGGDLWGLPGPAWRYDSGLGFVTLKLTTSGSHAIRVLGVQARPVALIPPVAQTIAFEFDNGPQGWFPAHQVDRWQVANGRWQGTATGGDPYLVRNRLRVAGDRYRQIVVKLRVTAGTGLALFWITEDNPVWAEDQAIHLPFANREAFYEYTFEVGQHRRWTGHTIVGLRVDPLEGGTGGDFEIEFIRGDSRCDKGSILPSVQG